MPDDGLQSIERCPGGPGRWRSDALGELPCIREGCTVSDSRLGPWSELMAGTRMARSSLGAYSYVAGDAEIMGAEIGRFCSIARCVRINPGNHPMGRATQHHCTYRRAQFGFGADDRDFFAWRDAHPVRIGHDVWIGHGAIIMPGVSIGTGAVVGAGAVVTREVAPYTVVAGVPARPLRERFPRPLAEALLRIAWWDWDRAVLEARIDELAADAAAFAERYDPQRNPQP